MALGKNSAPAVKTDSNHLPIPFVYQIIFLYVEPAMVCWAAFMGYYNSSELLSMLTRKTYAEPATAPTIEMIHQLSNEYLLVAILQAGVLRYTSERSVWKIFLACLLLADAVHLFNLGSLGLRPAEGVLAGMALLRVSFLLRY